MQPEFSCLPELKPVGRESVSAPLLWPVNRFIVKRVFVVKIFFFKMLPVRDDGALFACPGSELTLARSCSEI